MNRALYIGATSLMTNQRRLDVLSNNLANINTTGFKKDISIAESFPEKLLAKLSGQKQLSNIGTGQAMEYENNGEIYRARTKDGYFIVNTERGKSYVKEIEFVVDDQGYLKTSYKNLEDQNKTDNENYILNMNGSPMQAGGNIEGQLNANIYNPPLNVIGTMSGGVRFQKIFTDFTAGSIIETGSAFDIALKGDGFFKIAVDGETHYTRNGSFTVSQGYLTDLDGNRVLGREGEIALNGGEFSLSPNGDISVDGQAAGSLDIVNLDNKEFLRKRGDNLFYMLEGEEPLETDFIGESLQGHLESSNMNPISGMVEMINLLRDFETGQKLIRMQDEMLEKAANEVGRV